MKRRVVVLCFFISIFITFHDGVAAKEIPSLAQVTPGISQQPSMKNTGPLSIQECIDIALQNNRYRPVSRFAIEIAEAQYQQALSAYWPQLAIKATGLGLSLTKRVLELHSGRIWGESEGVGKGSKFTFVIPV